MEDGKTDTIIVKLEVKDEGNSDEEMGSWVEHFVERDSAYRGYTSSKEQVEELIQDFEVETHSHFIVRCTRVFFGQQLDLTEMKDRRMQIHWMDTHKETIVQLRNDGVPFVIMGSRTMECMYGPHLAQKKKQDKQKIRRSSSKKVGCVAKIHVRHIIKFPEYKKTRDPKDHYEQDKLSSKLRKKLSLGEVICEHQFHVQLPCHHTNHVTACSPGNQPPDRRLLRYLNKRSKDDKFTVREMQIILEEYLRLYIFRDKPLPPKTNTRFWPTRKTITYYLRIAYTKGKETTDNNKEKSSVASKSTPS